MAVKILALDTDASPDPASLARFKEEVDLQRRLSLHPFIVRFLGACYHVPRPLAAGGASSGSGSGATLAIVMELCRCGTLFKCLEYARRVAALPPSVRSGAAPPPTPDAARLRASPGWRLHASWTTRLALGQHVAAALAWMHSQRVVHRDLTSYNVLITDRFEAKVSDFNLARALRGGAGVLPASGALNSPEWAAPERLAGREYGPAADVYSLGVILHELVTLQVPWADRGGVSGVGGGASASGAAPPPSPASGPNGGPNAGGMVDTAFFVISSVPRGARLAFPTVVDPPLPELADVASLAAACWREDPATRPTAADVCSALEGVISRVRERQRAERGVGGEAGARGERRRPALGFFVGGRGWTGCFSLDINRARAEAGGGRGSERREAAARSPQRASPPSPSPPSTPPPNSASHITRASSGERRRQSGCAVGSAAALVSAKRVRWLKQPHSEVQHVEQSSTLP